MFDIGFAELIIIGVVALLVIGPERLPDAVRTASAWLNRLRRGFNDIKREVQQELHNDAVMRDLRESGESLRRETEALRQDLSSLNAPLVENPHNEYGSGKSGSDAVSEGRSEERSEERSGSDSEGGVSEEKLPRTDQATPDGKRVD